MQVDRYKRAYKQNSCQLKSLWLWSRYSQFSRNYFNCSQQFIRAKRNFYTDKIAESQSKQCQAKRGKAKQSKAK